MSDRLVEEVANAIRFLENSKEVAIITIQKGDTRVVWALRSDNYTRAEYRRDRKLPSVWRGVD